jgi:hypothetical protein
MKLIFTLFFWLIGISSLYAQHSLQSKYNMYRSGDEIIKQQVEYKDPGRSGENVLWDFSKLTSLDDGYTLSYIGDDFVIAGIEHSTMYYYKLSNDSLLLLGYENPTTLMINNQSELIFKFPVKYKDMCQSYCHGNGKYCNRLSLDIMGTIQTEADAYGMMILPNQDTIKNVVRTHTTKYIAETTKPLQALSSFGGGKGEVSPDSIDFRLATDTTIIGVETYRWYEKGYRYPIFETVKSRVVKQGDPQDFFSTAFFYPPQEHYYLDNDEENLALLEEDTEINDPQDNNPWAGLTYNFYPNPVEANLEIEIFMPKQGQVRMQLIDKVGGLVWGKNFGKWGEGIHFEQVFMSPFSRGEYVLNMWFDEYLVGEIILKK